MTDAAAGGGGQPVGFALPAMGDIGALLKRGDLGLAIGVMAILVILILPLPRNSKWMRRQNASSRSKRSGAAAGLSGDRG